MTGCRRALIVAGAAALLASLGCARGRQAAVPAEGQATLAALGHEVGLTFPASARLVGVSRERGIDDLVRFKVELPRADLASFLAAAPVPADAYEPGDGGFLGPDQGFWDPSRAVSLRTGQTIRDNHRTLNIGVAEAGPGRAAVYIVEHGT
jgi:hypothetical protein